MKFSKNASAKKVLTAIVSFVLLTNISFAQSSSSNLKSLNEDPLTVKYLCEEDSYLLFQVTMRIGNSTASFLQINDEAIGEIYSKKMAAHSSTIKFKIEKTAYQSFLFYLISDRQISTKSFVEHNVRDMIAVK